MSAAQHICDGRHLARHAYTPPRRRWFQGLAALLKEWRRRARSRNELAVLCDRCLRDIGATRYEVYREINKPFWRA
ncbi:MAG: DUF1127 domain-containing protein [Xanthobacteraceae bacterium]